MTTTTDLIPCGNKDDNGDTSCEHHSGAPVFHDALKGWSCCPKRVVDFDDFMKIAGCAVGRHVPASAAPAAPAKKATPSEAKPTAIVDGKEVYGSAPVKQEAAPAKPAAAAAAAAPATPTIKEEDLNDPVGATIPAGSACKRKSCTHVYSDEQCRSKECVFHSGSPIFHEGSKGWSCCSRKVLEFDEFLRIPGCKVGKHRFLDVETQEQQQVECRRDWYQTPTSVIVSIFAKKVDKATTTVKFTADSISIDATFQDGKKYVEVIPLALEIDPATSKYLVLSTKIELNLKKANGLSWPTLEMPADGVVLKSFTTFGVRDGNGQDAPLHLLQS
ncbi:HSP20-like chaperone [Obelidium mucronatum]|nr:HSP20-like chaperone [Obelidium mucronatum]